MLTADLQRGAGRIGAVVLGSYMTLIVLSIAIAICSKKKPKPKARLEETIDLPIPMTETTVDRPAGEDVTRSLHGNDIHVSAQSQDAVLIQPAPPTSNETPIADLIKEKTATQQITTPSAKAEYTMSATEVPKEPSIYVWPVTPSEQKALLAVGSVDVHKRSGSVKSGIVVKNLKRGNNNAEKNREAAPKLSTKLTATKSGKSSLSATLNSEGNSAPSFTATNTTETVSQKPFTPKTPTTTRPVKRTLHDHQPETLKEEPVELEMPSRVKETVMLDFAPIHEKESAVTASLEKNVRKRSTSATLSTQACSVSS